MIKLIFQNNSYICILISGWKPFNTRISLKEQRISWLSDEKEIMVFLHKIVFMGRFF